MIKKPFDEVVTRMTTVLTRHGYGACAAKILAHNCVSAQRDGSKSHGLFRVKDYLAAIQNGHVNGDPKPSVEDAAPGFVRADADNGYAQIAFAHAKDLVVRKAKQQGVAVLAIRNAHHTGALAIDVEYFAEQGLIALAFVNSIPVVAPPGGHTGVYGTNPIAFAAPRSAAPAIVFDQASSTMSHGDVQVAAREGRELPAGTGVDAEGRLTGDPRAILDGGALCTFGGYKGASMALLVEVLCGGLGGASFSFETWAADTGAMMPRKGEVIIVIDPAAGAQDLPPFAARVDDLVAALGRAGQTHIPGDRRVRARREAGGDVLMEDAQWQALEQLAAAQI